MSAELELFRCVPLSCSLTRASCGKKHLSHSTRAPRDNVGLVGTPSGTCSKCEVGAAHALGKEPSAWPDGAPIELVTRSRWTTSEAPEAIGAKGAAVNAKGETVDTKGAAVDTKMKPKLAGAKTCVECGATFAPTSNRQKFCTTTCAKKTSKKTSNRKHNAKRGPRKETRPGVNATSSTWRLSTRTPAPNVSMAPAAFGAPDRSAALESVVVDSEIWKVIRDLRSTEERLTRDLAKVHEALAVLTGASA